MKTTTLYYAVYGLFFLCSANAFLYAIEATSEQKIQQQEKTLFTTNEEMPEYELGVDSLIAFLYSNVVYPKAAIDSSIEGTVLIKFMVEKDGSMSGTHVVRGVHETIDTEALRVVCALPGRWKAGKRHGKLVRTEYILPIKFKLED